MTGSNISKNSCLAKNLSPSQIVVLDALPGELDHTIVRTVKFRLINLEINWTYLLHAVIVMVSKVLFDSLKYFHENAIWTFHLLRQAVEGFAESLGKQFMEIAIDIGCAALPTYKSI